MLFGLSMDYEVFLVCRMREEWDTGATNEEAVGEGLAGTGRLVTAAGLIMVAAFMGFVAGSIVGLQQFGFGLAAAILIDVTIVRALLVPSAMELFGRWNWWLPGASRASSASSRRRSRQHRPASGPLASDVRRTNRIQTICVAPGPGTGRRCASGSHSSSSARSRPLVLIAAPAAPRPASAYGIQDDAWLRHGPGTLDERLDQLERLGVDVVRFNLRWDTIERRAGRARLDAIATSSSKGLHERGIAAVVAIVGAPRWANGGKRSELRADGRPRRRRASPAPPRRATAGCATG